MVELLLIRHGQVRKATPDDVIGTLEDFPLIPEGVKQAEALGKYFLKEDISFDGIYVSPAVHAQQTAGIMASQSGHLGNLIVRNELRKNDHGDWKGRKLGEAYTPEVMSEMAKDPLNWRGHNGESRKQMGIRLRDFLYSVSEQSGRLAVVTHNLPIREFLRETRLIDLTDSPELPNTSITRLNYECGRFYLSDVGETPHLN